MAFRRSFDSLAAEFGRRRFLIGALGSGVALTHGSRLFAADDFWKTKDPSQWTEEEVSLLMSKSPWARTTVPTIKHADDPTEASGGGPQGGGGGAGRGNSGPPMTFRRAYVPIIVRWETAQPILDALKVPPPAGFEGHYVVSVTNLPGLTPRRPGRGDDNTPDDELNRLQNGATMMAKGKDAAEAGIARRTRIGSILFGFAKEYLPLTPSDREIIFKLDTETMTISVKFDGKEMVYHGKMAL